MDTKTKIITNGMLLSTAILWGSGFVARKMALIYVTPFFFNFLRFAIGFIVVFIFYRLTIRRKSNSESPPLYKSTSYQILGAFIIGTLLAWASALQQWALIYTPAGKTSFITSLYAIFVPILGVFFLKAKIKPQIWFGAVLAIIGLFCINGGSNFSVALSDLVVLLCAVVFAIQIIVIGIFSPNSRGLFLNTWQIFFGCLWSLLLALLFEHGNTLEGVISAFWPTMYSGAFALGLAYTFQIVAQSKAIPWIAAIVLSLESVFGAFFGALFLGERMSLIQLIGCLFIFSAVLLSQLPTKNKSPSLADR